MFLVEGNKTIKEIPGSAFKITELFSTDPSQLNITETPITQVSATELKKISFLRNPKDSVAVCELNPEHETADAPMRLILDGIQDPGNMGTIIRLADWFGIQEIICSADTVDFYNPKVIQACMGSFLRVNIRYTDLLSYIENSKVPVIGTDMDGTDLYGFDFPEQFNLVLGNEGNGIRQEVENLLTEKITIPRFGNSKAAESLNVAMSAGIILGQVFSK